MAKTVKPLTEQLNDDAIRVTWTDIADGDTVEACASIAEYADRSVQITGAFDGGILAVKGSNDGANFLNLTDPQGTAISGSSTRLRQITEFTVQVKPDLSGAGGSASVNVTLVAKRNRR